jgi:GNAT superfamily N-acetyltransferase
VQETNMVSIRVADVRDAAVLADLGRRTFRETFAADNTPEDMAAYTAEAFTVGRIAAEIGETRSVFLVAEASQEAVGFARLAPEAPPACVTGPSPIRLVKLYVSADAIGSGVGAALVRASFEWASNSGHRTLWLGVWEHNLRARAFYERWGFAPVGFETFRLGSDDQNDVLMQLILSERAG